MTIEGVKPKTKRDLFTEEPHRTFPGRIYRKMKPEYKKFYEDYKRNLPSIEWVSCLKDELRSLKKVETGATRLFSIAPVQYVMLGREITMHMQEQLYNARLTCPVSIGINAHSDEWGIFISKLSTPINPRTIRYLAGDKSKYDMTVPNEFNQQILEFFKLYSDEEMHADLDYFFEEIMYGKHVVLNQQFIKSGGNCSGGPITALMNSLTNALMDLYIFVKGCLFHGLNPREAFPHGLQIRAYGDDDIIAVDSSLYPWYTMKFLATEFAILGIKYTDASKGYPQTDYVEREDVSYLKRNFVLESDYVYAPRPLEEILEQLNWYRIGTVSAEQQCKFNVEDVMRELAHHPREVFVLWRNNINKILMKHGFSIVPDNFYETRQHMMNAI
uniref:Putative nonstructural protein n=1 Tax=Riboviria sp. TaxID=2585031 RepID=A0A8K1HJE8_9VIRU|nr:putative nonstructural protein [Riboviria sp.]